ncbi:MAG: 2-oxoacid:acceptor oxidoreductase family protein [Candidatus Riflebacteria bacterium]|nr:2-oxoacid:acceptor oxidoreductase family protein [Candidatus Riflebacteria bacterium]
MNIFNIYISGVGGQGVGVLSELIIRGADHCGKEAKAVDTHGLAQRGGVVESFVRIGNNIHSPLIKDHEADLVIALERHEALRAINRFGKKAGTLAYFDAIWQPLEVRLGTSGEVTNSQISETAIRKNIKVLSMKPVEIPDTRMQNISLLSVIIKNSIIPGLTKECVIKAMSDFWDSATLESNIRLIEKFSN